MSLIEHHYHIGLQEPNTLVIHYRYRARVTGPQKLCLPIWRPGRYQAQHFAKNIGFYQAWVNEAPKFLGKIKSNIWTLDAEAGDEVCIRYHYVAQQADAGGSFLAADFCYINPITCALFLQGMEEAPVLWQMDLPSDWQVHPKAMHSGSHHWEFPSYRALVDQPILAAPRLECLEWQEQETQFSLVGKAPQGFFNTQYVEAVRRIVAFQMQWMRSSPGPNYAFLHWICPEPFYHGVEHANNTMMVLGPPDRDLNEDLIGLASHEFFHVWNGLRIRPSALCPYDYLNEIPYDTAWVVEGLTTYLGDWFVWASGACNSEQYLSTLLGNLKLHFDRDGQSHQNLLDASVDLWLDGYGKALPDKRVSIYFKGALVALGLDVMIRQKFQHQKSIQQVLWAMEQAFAMPQQGYDLDQFKALVEEVFEGSLEAFWRDWVYGNKDLFSDIQALLGQAGLILSKGEQGLQLFCAQPAVFATFQK